MKQKVLKGLTEKNFMTIVKLYQIIKNFLSYPFLKFISYQLPP